MSELLFAVVVDARFVTAKLLPRGNRFVDPLLWQGLSQMAFMPGLSPFGDAF
jgi:hypothetical protein